MSTKTAPAKAASTKAPAKAAAKPAAKATAKAAAKATAKPAAEKPVKAPAAETKDEKVEPAAEAAEKRTRQQLTNVLHIDISQARCATHLKQNLGDGAVTDQIKELRKEIKAAKDAGDSAKESELKAQVAALSQNMVRISSVTPIATAVVMDGLVKEQLRHGMKQALASERKIVEVSHLHEGEIKSMLYYPIFNKLPTFMNYNPAHEEELRVERAAANKAAKDAREAKKGAAEAKPAAKPKAAKPAAKEAKVEEDGEEESAEPVPHSKTTFFTYVENALKGVKKEEEYHAMRVGNRVREYLADLVADGLARLATLARIVVHDVVGVRTMNADHIKAVVRFLVVDEHRGDEKLAEDQAEEIIRQIDAKLGIYRTHVISEKEKKSAALAQTKKDALELKKLEADVQRKKKQAELAVKRSKEAASKAESLSAEAAGLEPVLAEKAAAAKAAAVEAPAAATAEPAST